MLGITDQVQLQLFFESRKGFGFPTVPRTSNLKGLIAHLVLVLGMKTSDEFDDRSRDLLQSSDSGLISSTK